MRMVEFSRDGGSTVNRTVKSVAEALTGLVAIVCRDHCDEMHGLD
jgi:hypothetical protein